MSTFLRRIVLVPERRHALPNAKLSLGYVVDVAAPVVVERMEVVLRDALGHEVMRDATIGPAEDERETGRTVTISLSGTHVFRVPADLPAGEHVLELFVNGEGGNRVALHIGEGDPPPMLEIVPAGRSGFLLFLTNHGDQEIDLPQAILASRLLIDGLLYAFAASLSWSGEPSCGPGETMSYFLDVTAYVPALSHGPHGVCLELSGARSNEILIAEPPALLDLLRHASRPEIEEALAMRGQLALEEARGPGGWSPLICAAAWGRHDLLVFFLEAGASVEEQDDLGYTPLHHAASRTHRLVLDLLIARGAWIDARTHEGVTPLMLAAARGHLEMVLCLLAAGADPTALDGQGEPVIYYALDRHHTDIAKILERAVEHHGRR